MNQDASQLFMRRAIGLATANVLSGKGGPFAAVIVKDGVIVGEGANSVTRTCDPTAHGEVNAIRDACARLRTFSLERCEIYSSSEPCPMCLAAIYWSRLERIYFGNNCETAASAGFRDAAFYQQMTQPWNQRMVPALQLLPEEAAESFQVWMASPLKVDY